VCQNWPIWLFNIPNLAVGRGQNVQCGVEVVLSVRIKGEDRRAGRICSSIRVTVSSCLSAAAAAARRPGRQKAIDASLSSLTGGPTNAVYLPDGALAGASVPAINCVDRRPAPSGDDRVHYAN